MRNLSAQGKSPCHSSSPGEETQPQGLQAACQLELAAVTAVEPSVAKAADVPGGGEDD